jgi:hypothetical protein
VRPLGDSIATFAGLENTPSLTAGDSIAAFTVMVTDKLGNTTDNSTAQFTLTRTGGSSTATVRATRIGIGRYIVQATSATIAGTYSYNLVGCPTILGQRTVEVVPASAARVDFAGVKEIVLAGAKQSAVQATFRDRFGNTTDRLLPENYAVWYSNSTDATLRADEALTAQETLTQRVNTTTGVPIRGLYQASTTVAFPAEGLYSLAVAGISVTTGTTAFEVVPNVDTRVTVEGLRDTITAGEMLPAFTVRYFDASGNPTDNSVGRVTYTRAGGSSTATISMMRTNEGVYAVSATRATLSGVYNLSVRGINPLNVSGAKTFVVRPTTLPATVEIVISTTAMTARGANVTFTINYYDEFNNRADWVSDLTITNDEVASTASVDLVRQSLGVWKKTITVLQPGGYDVAFDTPPPGAEIIGANSFGCSPGKAVRVRFSNVPSSMAAGSALTGAFMTFYDVRGRTTNNNSDIINLSSRGAEVIDPITFSPRDAIAQHSGVFDISPVSFAALGLSNLRVDSDVDGTLPSSGNSQITVIPGPAVKARIQTTPANALISAGSPIALEIRYTDALGNPTNCNEKITFVTMATTVVATPARTLVNGLPVYTAAPRFNTVGTYSVNIANIAINGTTNIIVYNGIARYAEFQNITAELTVGESQFFTVILRDNFGNFATNAPQLNFSNGSTSTGTITLIRLPNGYWSAQSPPFAITGNYTLSFSTPPPLTMAGARTFRVVGNPLPELRNLSPFEVTLNTSATLIASGDFFVQGATAIINNVPIPTIFRSPTQLEIQLPTSFTATLGSMVLNIRNPAPGGGVSLAGISVTVLNPVPVLLALRPATIIRDCSQQTTLAMADKFAGAHLTQTPQTHFTAAKPAPIQESIPVTGIESLARELTLYPVAPNPVSDRASLRYALSEESSVMLEILDTRSQRVATLVQEQQRSGTYTTEWKPDGALASGTYYVRLTATTNAGKRVQRQQTITFIK